MSDHNFLSNLNEQQYKAVVSPASSLQILAGPGSGKTRVLTTRAAWLVLEKKIDPERIMVVTFTNKAARDMKEKLEQPTLLGKRVSSQLKMGTFHSICACIVRRYYSFVGLKSNFTIVEPATCLKLNSANLRRMPKKRVYMFDLPICSFKGVYHRFVGYFYSEISKAKNQGLKCAEFAATRGKEFKYRDIAVLYSAYEERLLSQNLVDFDNLLLYGRDLFRYVTELENFVGHVLVDEFQDTNVVQYDLVCLLTQKGQSLTIVGDPDQAIFGWRYADVTNFIKMRSDFPQTEIVNLERNYRSTSSILNSALHVVSYDKDRIEKALFTTNAEGVQTSLLSTSSAETEAGTVAEEILRIVKYSNGLISYKDIAVLVRMNFMSRNLEQAFAALSLPHIVLGGLRFFERAEVKDILSYLSFFHNPYDTEALERIINAPKRGIGEVTLQRIQKLCHERKAEAIDILKAICGITKPSEPCDVVISAAAKNGLKRLLNLCTEVQTMLKEKQTIADIIKHIVSSLEYEQYLKLSYKQDWESRWENIGELVTVAKSFASGSQTHTVPALSTDTSDLLVQFLESTTLDVDRKEHEEASEGKVTIATMHTAKGLEWPVVFVVGCEEGIVPHQKADTKEESRLLYVAMTRPRCFLYCTYARVRTVWGNTKASDLTRFLSNLSPDFYQERTPPWDAKVRTWVAGLLNRPLPEESGNLEHPGDYYPVLSEDNK
ncbi:P-loop containing nucleoside triphosphate hydrolase protein [Radiomyces spectabilis]|uniref:P-loop containing nucleoside triphosphate hydrolase protein n=1 Tax=Radiomyces spectabilis TaxID=64574 RepID=UPI00221F7BD8|nr:P-loop containing nucleoside triphosphate hydrolase protein [Radiomyces spectabilis]KAI8366619.1 P-loop containing nucleoside triphosphate hydrolase protein [Radiomyces spectabilis]